jgi:hypothetical protein
MMKKIRLIGQLTLTMEQPNRFRPVYELRAGSDVLGKMKLEGVLISVARVSSGDGDWEFIFTRFIMPRISVRSRDQNYLGSFESRRDGSGTLELVDGRKLFWSANGHLQNEWCFSEKDGKTLLRFKPKSLGGTTGQVEMSPEALNLQEVTPLVFLGWYLLNIIAGEEDSFSSFLNEKKDGSILDSLM